MRKVIFIFYFYTSLLRVNTNSSFEFVLVGLPTFLIIKVAQNKWICPRMSQTKPKTNILVGLKKIVKYELFFTYLLLFLVKPNNLDWMPYLLATHYIRHPQLLWTCIVTIVIVCPCTNKNLSIWKELICNTWRQA